MARTFQGYLRPDGKVGVRNYVVVMSSVSCANGVVEAIGRAVPEVKTITHTEGCGRAKDDLILAAKTLEGLGRNPNSAAVLVVGLGCEALRRPRLVAGIADTGKPVETIGIQNEGGSGNATEKGIEIVHDLLEKVDAIERQEFGLDVLTLGLECGGSDALSGVTANPTVGACSDIVVGDGGRVIFAETTEMFGTEEILANKAKNETIGREIIDLITTQKEEAIKIMGPRSAGRAISPGNMDGGLTTIREKSLGCIIKAGSTPINQVVKYAQIPDEPGVIVMDTPGSDIFSLTGMAAGGAQILIFTTGRGTPVGFPNVPVIKISSNSKLYQMMENDMDLNAGQVLEGKTINEMGEELADLVVAIANGDQTCAEVNKQEMLAIHTTTMAF
jgi:altronate dehydratase large subunit